MEDRTTIKNLYSRGYGKKTIAKMLNISKNTVKKALAQEEVPQYKGRFYTDKLLAPYEDQIKEMYFEQRLIDTRIFKGLKERGYQGPLTTIYHYLKSLGPREQGKVTCRFGTSPGEQA